MQTPNICNNRAPNITISPSIRQPEYHTGARKFTPGRTFVGECQIVAFFSLALATSSFSALSATALQPPPGDWQDAGRERSGGREMQ